MRPSIFAAAAVAGCAVLTGPAAAASGDPLSPQQTIGELEAAGYTVNVDRVGSAPLGDCVVTSVRNPQTVTEWIRVWDGDGKGRHGDGGGDWDLVPIVVSRSISVSLDCTR